METIETTHSTLLTQVPAYMSIDTVPLTATPALFIHSKYTHGGGMMIRTETILGVDSLVLYRWGSAVLAVQGPSALTTMAREVSERLGVC